MGLGKNLLAGLAGGLVGGAILSVIELGGMKTGRIPTSTIVAMEHRLEDMLNIAERSTYRQKVARSQMMHFLTTALYGLVYGALRSIPRVRRIPSVEGDMVPVTGQIQIAERMPRIPAPVAGPLFGLGVFATVMGGIMPALGLARAPWQMRRGVALRELALHLLFGAVLAGTFRLFKRSDSYDPQI